MYAFFLLLSPKKRGREIINVGDGMKKSGTIPYQKINPLPFSYVLLLSL